MAKESITIEALLHRAYGQYRVDRVTPAAILGMPRYRPGGSLVGVMSTLQLGTIIDNSGAAARMLGAQSMAAATPDDLLVVHDHVLALSEWMIEDAESAAPQVWKRSDIAANGWRVEDAATGLWLVRPGQDGAADGWSRLQDPFLTVLVIEHARAGSRPDHGGPLAPQRGRPDAEARAARADVMLTRAIYATWHAALGLLAADLAGTLTKHDVQPPASPAAPWDGGNDGALLASQAVQALPRPKSTGRKSLRQKEYSAL